MNPRHQPRGPNRQAPPLPVFFDPSKDKTQLLDELAEKQADCLPDDCVTSSQLRRFFGEIKDLFRRFNTLVATLNDPDEIDKTYCRHIEPLFKMVRSKVAYATRAGGQSKLDQNFADFLEQGIAKVSNAEQFQLFVYHLEAVVGFMYGKDKVSKR